MTTTLLTLLTISALVQPPAGTILRTGAYPLDSNKMVARAPPYEVVFALPDYPSSVTTERLANPKRLVLDIRTTGRLGEQRLAVGHHGLTTVRTSDREDGKVRVVFDVNDWNSYTIARERGAVRVVFTSRPTDTAAERLIVRDQRANASAPLRIGSAKARLTTPPPGQPTINQSEGRATPASTAAVLHAAMPVNTATAAQRSPSPAVPTKIVVTARPLPSLTTRAAPKAAVSGSGTPNATARPPRARSTSDVTPASSAPTTTASRPLPRGYRSIDAATRQPPVVRPAPLAAPTAGTTLGSIVQKTKQTAARAEARAARRTAMPEDPAPSAMSPSPAPLSAPSPLSAPLAAPAPSAKPVASKPAGDQPASAPSAPKSRESKDHADLISVEFNDTDIRYVLQVFADYAKQSIIAGKKVEGKITAKLTNVPWRSGLDELLRVNGLAMEIGANGIIRVDNLASIQARQSYELPVTRIVRVNYLPARDLAPSVAAVLSRECMNFKEQMAANGGQMMQQPMAAMGGNAQNVAMAGNLAMGCFVRGSVAFDTTTNRLIITEVPRQIGALEGYIKQLDVKVPRVRITAKIMAVNRTGLKSLGVTYDLGMTDQFSTALVPRPDPSTLQPVDNNGDGINDGFRATGNLPPNIQTIKLNGSAISGIANANVRVANPAVQLVATTLLGGSNLTAFLDAVQTQELGELTAEPSVTTLSNRSARLLSGEEVPVRVIDAAATAVGGGQAPRATVSFKEVGIILDVTPSVTESGQILMRVQAENSSATIAGTDVGVTFQRSSGRATILVSDGESIPIGGLVITEKSSIETGVPFLRTLPYVGRFFRTTTEQQRKRDLLIVVTPEIVKDGTVLPTSVPSPRKK